MYETLQKIRKLNPGISILPIEDQSFGKYGRVHTHYDVADFLNYVEKHAKLTDTVVYEPDSIGADRYPQQLIPIIQGVYGGLGDVQVGWVHGRNQRLNALEYHKGAEVVMVGADMVIMMGQIHDIVWPDGTYDVANLQVYYVPKGTVYEIAPHCLHYAPVHVYADAGFKCAIILPKGTNTPLDFEPGNGGEDILLLAKNKWLIAHLDDTSFRGSRAQVGLLGPNITIHTNL
jgi:hypothetical protein